MNELIYLVRDYHGEGILGVFDNLDLAKKMAKNHYSHLELSDWEDIFSLSDQPYIPKDLVPYWDRWVLYNKSKNKMFCSISRLEMNTIC